MFRFFGCLFLLFAAHFAWAQTATIYGKITDRSGGEPLPGATVRVSGSAVGVAANEKGEYTLTVSAARSLVVEVSYIGYQTEPTTLRLREGERHKLNIKLRAMAIDRDTFVVKAGKQATEINRTAVDVEAVKSLPMPSGNVESALTIFGLGARAGSGGELTAQYSVRGGNYDENLVYVNGFEVYRPLLIRSGQQEGLTFPNIDLIRSMSFSSGGFEAAYGDKMSSVLDIEYKNPTDNKSTCTTATAKAVPYSRVRSTSSSIFLGI